MSRGPRIPAARYDDCGNPLPPKSRKPVNRAQKAMVDKKKQQQANKVYERLRKDGVWI